jgi:hypothetical protein
MSRRFRRDVLSGAAGIGAVGAAGCLVTVDPQDPAEEDPDEEQEEMEEGYDMRVGTSTGGTWDVGLAIERTINQQSDRLSYSSIESAGYVGTTYRLSQGLFDAGVVDTNTMLKARDDLDMFEETPIDVLPWQGFQAFPYGIYVMALDGTGIKTFDDLAGAEVYPAEPGFSTRETTLDIWEMPQVRDVYEEMEIADMDVDDAPGAMEEARVDAAIAYGTPGVGNTGWVLEYDARTDVHYVEPTDALIEAAEEYPGVDTAVYDVEEFDWGQDIGTDEIFTWILRVTYAFHPSTPEEAVYELVRVVHEHSDEIREAEEQFNEIQEPEDLTVAAIEDYPFHPGVAEYLQEHDAWNEDWIVGEEAEEHS